METRKITIVSTKTQKKYVVESDATTLGQLKELMSSKGIDFDNMTFYEGLSKTELNHDDSVLPSNIERNGQTTNELVFMLTNINKKIESGALSVIRAAAYKEIQDRGLQEMVKHHFGRNYTQLNTAALVDFIEDLKGELETEAPSFEEALLDVLYNKGIITAAELGMLKSILEKPEVCDSECPCNNEPESPYSDSEICELFDHLL